MNARTCKHASSGCDYPTGQCDGGCMAKPAQATDAERHARAITEGKLAAELLRELRHAHQIIKNALNLMTIDQKFDWGTANARDGVNGDGITRFHEREAVLAASMGRQS